MKRTREQIAVEKFIVKSQELPTVMPPKSLFIAVRQALGISVFGFVRYPMPDGKAEIRYQRIG